MLLWEKIEIGKSLTNKLGVLKVISTITIITTLGIGIVLTIILAKYLTDKISRPIKDIVDISKKIAKGNLDVSV